MIKDDEEVMKNLVTTVKQKINESKANSKKIEMLQSKINQMEALINKFNDDLVEYKEHKHFLDVMAIQAGKKKYNPINKIVSSAPEQMQHEVAHKMAHLVKDTFLTQP